MASHSTRWWPDLPIIEEARLRYPRLDPMLSTSDGVVLLRTRGPWHILVGMLNVPCEDGIRRNVRIRAEADTFFSIPASVSAKNKTVTGFVSSSEQYGHRFFANEFGKNASIIKKQKGTV